MKHALRSLIVLIVLGFGESPLARGQSDPDFAALDRYVDTLAAHDRAMGVLHVSSGDSTIYSRAIGMAALETPTPATPERRYRIGSISKSFTAAVVMALVEEEELRLDDKLAGYFPSVPDAADITIRQLLAHRSGINSITDAEDLLAWKDDPVPRDSMLARMARRAPVFAPGTQTGYSNSNYILLTYLIEDLTGRSYPEALEEYVLAPLALERTTADALVDLAEGHALGYYWGPSGWERATDTHPSVPLGAGAIAATAEDVARFYRGLLTGRVVGDSALAQMLTLGEDPPHMGLGVFPMPFGDKRGYGHNGSIDGFQSQAGYWPADSLAVVWLGNATRTTPNDIMIAALSASYGQEVAIPDFNPRTVEPEGAYLDSLAGTYTSSEFPLDIELTNGDGVLVAQASGQAAFPLTALEGNVFWYESGSIYLHFPEPGVMDFEQRGLQVRFTRD